MVSGGWSVSVVAEGMERLGIKKFVQENPRVAKHVPYLSECLET